MNYEKYFRFGMDALDQTRSFILQSIKDGFEKGKKPDKSFVTSADKGAERILRSGIEDNFPGHGIVGEEYGATNKTAEYVWYLDPIDGTAEFVNGLPQYGTLLSLHYKREPILGLVDHPSLDLRLHAVKGNGSFINEERITINGPDGKMPIENEMIAIGPRFMFEKHGAGRVYDEIISAHKNISEVQNCHWYTRLLQGEFGAVIDYGLRMWDISHVKILVEEAGGSFYNVEEKIIDNKDRHAIISGKPHVVDWIMHLKSYKQI